MSWRTVGSTDTFVLGMWCTHGNAKIAGSIAGTEILLFYFHERAWSVVKWGHRPYPAAADQSGDGMPLTPAPGGGIAPV